MTVSETVPTFVVVLAVVTATMVANPQNAAAEGVHLEILSVLARNQGNALDPRLRAHKSYLADFPYSSYQLLRQERRHVSWGRRVRFNLPGPGEVAVRPRMREESGIALDVALRGHRRRRLVETNLCLQDHRVLMMGGPRHRDGVLIILVRRVGGRAQRAEIADASEVREIR